MSALTLEIVEDDEAFRSLQRPWRDLERDDPDVNVFLAYPWVSTWWQHFGAGRDGHRLHVVVVRDDEGVVAIAPLFRSRVGAGPLAVPLLQRLAPDAGDYGGVLLGRRADEAVALLVEHLAARLRDDVAIVRLSRLASDARFTALLGEELVRQSAAIDTVVEPLGGACLYTDVTADFDLRKQTKKHKIRRYLGRLSEQHGEVAFVHHTGDTLDEGLDRLVALHDKRWQTLDEPMQGLMASPDGEAFLLAAVRALDAHGAVRLLTVEAGGTPIGAELDFCHRDRVFLFKGAFDPDYAAFSPGQLLNHQVFVAGMAEGIELFDWCRGDAEYKRRWTNGERHLSTVTLARPGLPGALARRRLRAARALDRRRP